MERSYQDLLESRMQGKLARPVWGWGPGETPGPTPLFIGSSAAGEVAAMMYTLIASASRHSVDLWAYVDDVLRQLAGGESDLDSLLPDRWAVAHPKSIRTYRQLEDAARAAKTKQRRARRRKLPTRS